ncbi:MAG: hypothetical protein ACFBRM_05820 [Pikeienuella sp.]
MKLIVAALLAGSVQAAPDIGSPKPPAAPVHHVTAQGVSLVLPEIDGLGCDELRTVLRRLDMSGYRGAGPLPSEHIDYAVFAYEDALASALYFECTLRETRRADPASAFGRGFGRTY